MMSSRGQGPLCVKIMKEHGRYVYRTSYRYLTEDEQISPEEVKKRESYDQMIYSKLESSASTQDFEEDYSTPEYELYEDDGEDGIFHAKEYDDELTPITYDTYIGAEVVLPKGNNMVSGNVMSRVKDSEGYSIGKADKNPILNTSIYNDEFSCGENANYDDEPTPITYDIYIVAEVVLPKGNDMVSGTVMSRVNDSEG